jgi:sarcosine oxidase subunit alpha
MSVASSLIGATSTVLTAFFPGIDAITCPRKMEKFHETVNREVFSVRNNAGILDASTLGKIDIKGPDATKFLNLIYTNSWSNLKIGKCRYGLMLKDDGMVMDDGVTSRLGPDHFHMTTTTGGAANVLNWATQSDAIPQANLKH